MRWFRNRKYKSGTGWCFWRWTDVTSEYIVRLHVLKTPWFAICLHWLLKPDPEPYLHDHPVTFLSVILRGGYSEVRERSRAIGTNIRAGNRAMPTHRWFNFIRASKTDDRHTITETKPGTLTLCFMGPKTREWGYHTEFGWVYWKDYEAARKSGHSLGTWLALNPRNDLQRSDVIRK